MLQQTVTDSEIEKAVERVRILGYATLDAGYSSDELAMLSATFDSALEQYQSQHGLTCLKKLNEHNNIRLMTAQGDGAFLQLAMNPALLAALGKLIEGRFILNQQNAVINPAGEEYNQGAWHRDLPYQHFVSSTPLAINALFCVDEFTAQNGATFVLPASHKNSAFPSAHFIEHHAIQVTAKAGHFILLDCMTFHSGGFNASERDRRAINHLYNIPYFKQQINIPTNIDGSKLSPQEREILGFTYQESATLAAYLATRKR